MAAAAAPVIELPDAVETRGLSKAYGHGKGKTRALNEVNMNVEQGSM
jgi:ABC-type dipeptide/oligopeptide/nickel transport system ATPase subunit